MTRYPEKAMPMATKLPVDLGVETLLVCHM